VTSSDVDDAEDKLSRGPGESFEEGDKERTASQYQVSDSAYFLFTCHDVGRSKLRFVGMSWHVRLTVKLLSFDSDVTSCCPSVSRKVGSGDVS
jgi:hypothetical protein